MHTSLTASDLDEYRAMRLWLVGTKPPCMGRVWRRAPQPSNVYQDGIGLLQSRFAWVEAALFYLLAVVMIGASLCFFIGVFAYVWVLAHRHLWVLVMATGVGLGVACLSYGCLRRLVVRALGHGALWFLMVMAVAGAWMDF